MHIVEEDAEGFLRAFHGDQERMIVALIILAFRRTDLELFTSLLEGVTEVDQALGEEIGLFLFYPEQMQCLFRGHNSSHYMAGERIDAHPKIGTHTQADRFFTTLKYSATNYMHQKHLYDLVARSSVSIVYDFCSALEVDPDELPCVCTLIKGVPGAIVSRAGDRLSYESIVRAARALRPQVQRIQNGQSAVLASMPALQRDILLLEHLTTQEERLRIEVLNLAGSLERRYSIVLRPQISAMMSARRITVDKFESLIREISKSRADDALANSRTQGIRSRIEKILKITNSIERLRTKNDITKLSRHHDIVRDADESLRKAAENAFAEAGITIWRYRDQFAQIAKVSPILGVIAKAITLFRRTFAPI